MPKQPKDALSLAVIHQHLTFRSSDIPIVIHDESAMTLMKAFWRSAGTKNPFPNYVRRAMKLPGEYSTVGLMTIFALQAARDGWSFLQIQAAFEAMATGKAYSGPPPIKTPQRGD